MHQETDLQFSPRGHEYKQLTPTVLPNLAIAKTDLTPSKPKNERIFNFKKSLHLEQISQIKEMNRRTMTQRPTPQVRPQLGRPNMPMQMLGVSFKRQQYVVNRKSQSKPSPLKGLFNRRRTTVDSAYSPDREFDLSIVAPNQRQKLRKILIQKGVEFGPKSTNEKERTVPKVNSSNRGNTAQPSKSGEKLSTLATMEKFEKMSKFDENSQTKIFTQEYDQSFNSPKMINNGFAMMPHVNSKTMLKIKQESKTFIINQPQNDITFEHHAETFDNRKQLSPKKAVSMVIDEKGTSYTRQPIVSDSATHYECKSPKNESRLLVQTMTTQPDVTNCNYNLSPSQRRMPVDTPFKRKFEIHYEETRQVSKINMYKDQGTVKDPEDPLFKILGERSIAYGKGLGGGGGMYIPGIKASAKDKILPMLNLSTLKNDQWAGIDPNIYKKHLNLNTNGYCQDLRTAPHESLQASKMVDRHQKLQKAREIQFQNNQLKLQKQFQVANPAKKIKDHLGLQYCTKNILFGEFDSFKNWDTRIGLTENLNDERNKMLGYQST